MQEQSLNEIVRRQARTQPDAVAYRTPVREWTFKQIDEESDRVAQGLKSLGVGPGHRVAALTKYTAECVVLTVAANKIGAVCMPVNWRLAAPELEVIFRNGEARFLMVDGAFLPAARQTAAYGGMTVVATDSAEGLPSFAAWREGFPAVATGYQPQGEETALQLYSSGTTGLPKGVELSHANLLSIFAELGTAFRYSADRSILFNALPTFHIAGMGLALVTLAQGGQTVFYPDFDPPRIIAGIAQHRITHMFLVPAMILALVNTPGVDKADFSTLEVMAYGASPISEKVLIDAMRVFKCGFLQVYGLTETTGAVTYLPAEDHDPGGPRAYLLRAAGKPGVGVQLRIVDSASGKDCADGQVGEVWIHTRQNMKGYWRNPEATRQAFPEGHVDGIGWFRSGDAGYMRDGYLFLHDRIKDMIISGGENIYPAEVENALMQHPAVADGAVIGVPDDKWGEAVKACVVLKPGATATEQEIVAFMRERIAHFKCPKTVDFMTMLPRNPTGKLLKYILRKPYWEGRDRQVS